LPVCVPRNYSFTGADVQTCNFDAGNVLIRDKFVKGVSNLLSSLHPFASSSTTPGRPSSRNRRPPLVLFLVVDSLVRDTHNHPVAQELAENAAEDNGDKDVTVERHDDQHDDVGDAEGQTVEDGAAQLLQRGCAEGSVLGAEGDGGPVAAVCRDGRGDGGLLDAQTALEGALQVCVELCAHTAQELEGDDEEGCADAAGGEHGVVLDVPRAGEDARVDDAPVPCHLGELAGRFECGESGGAIPP
jgi:hypothetical protein